MDCAEKSENRPADHGISHNDINIGMRCFGLFSFFGLNILMIILCFFFSIYFVVNSIIQHFSSFKTR